MKKVSKIKRLVSIALIFLFSINTFAAIVSDNDGSAFVTKAEFDALKNSFADQIDNYNKSIDGKIDGAIASYLAGIGLASTEAVAQLCYIAAGIMSPRAGYKDLNFKQGILDWDVYWYLRGADTMAKLAFTGIRGTDAKYNFNEMGINDIFNGTSGFVGSWDGFVTTKQKLVQTGIHQIFSQSWPYIMDPMQFGPNAVGFGPFDNFDFNHDMTEHHMFSISLNVLGVGSSTVPGGTWNFKAYQNTATRTVLAKTNESIIITPKSVYCKRFSRMDAVMDWYNCQDTLYDPSNVPFKKFTDGNTTSTLKDFWSSAKCEAACGNGSGISNRTINFWTGKTGDNDVYYFDGSTFTKNKPSDWDTNHSWLPYFGFCNSFSDYNQLYNKLYDGKVPAMKSAHTDLNVIKDKDGVEHLALSAGAPIVEVKQNNIVDMDVNFKDKTVDYDVWFKVGSFDASKEPTDETTLLPLSNIKVDSVASVSGQAAKSVKITKGQGNVKITIPEKEKGFLFMKWQYANTDVVGGGTYMPNSTVMLTVTG